MAEQKGGRPIAASMRPTGGDKALVSRKQYFRRKKVCKLSVEKVDDVTYRDFQLLKQFISENGRILPQRITGTSPAFQRRLARAIKQARNIALLPFNARG